MKKNYLLLPFISLSLSAQIGVNTSNPQGVFNVDGQKNNPATGTPTVAQQQDDFVVTQQGRVGIGTTAPTAKLEINNGTTAGAIKIVDGTQAEGKFLVSDANGVGTWRQTSGNTTVVTSTVGPVTTLGINYTNLGSSAVVPQDGYYIISPRLITDKTPVGCGNFIAYNLFKSATTTTGVPQAFSTRDVHMAAGPGQYDFIYTSNVAYLTTGTYYMWVRVGNGCTTNTARTNIGQNSFTLTLLK